MPLVDLLKKDYEEKLFKSNQYEKECKEKIESIIRSSLIIPNDIELKIYSDFRSNISSINNNGWSSSYDCIRIELRNDKNSYDISLDLYNDGITINNCCSGAWKSNSLYRYYIDAISQLINNETTLYTFAASIDRTIFKDCSQARRELDKENYRLELEAEEKELNEIRSAILPGTFIKMGQDSYADLIKINKICDKTVLVEVYSQTRNWSKRDENGDYIEYYALKTKSSRKDIKDLVSNIYWQKYSIVEESEINFSGE